MRFLVPDHLRYIDLYGVLYYMPWEEFLPGRSVFLKTTATARSVQRKLKPAETYLQIVLRAHARHEFGYYGVRVWRIG
jgi:hypothetical protein